MKQKNKRRTYKKRGGGIKQFGTKCDKSDLFEGCTFLEQVGQPIELSDYDATFCKVVKLKISKIPIKDNKFLIFTASAPSYRLYKYPVIKYSDKDPMYNIYAFYDYQVSDSRRNAATLLRASTAIPLYFTNKITIRKDFYIFIEKIMRNVMTYVKPNWWIDDNGYDMRDVDEDFFDKKNGVFIITNKDGNIIYEIFNVYSCFKDIEDRIIYMTTKLEDPKGTENYDREEDRELFYPERNIHIKDKLKASFLEKFLSPNDTDTARRIKIPSEDSNDHPELSDDANNNGSIWRGGRRVKKTRRKTRRR